MNANLPPHEARTPTSRFTASAFALRHSPGGAVPLLRRLVLTSLLATFIFGEPAQGQEAQAAKKSLRLDITTEDAGQTPINIVFKVPEAQYLSKVVKRLDPVIPGLVEVDLSEVPDGDCTVYFESPEYAGQWHELIIKNGKAEPRTIKAKLCRRRYVVLRYAFNISGGRELTGSDIEEGRVAVSHWGSLPYFGQDWQVWQKSLNGSLFGDTPFLEFHRISEGTSFGFAKVPKGVAFDDLKEAPAGKRYSCESRIAENGLMLFCRVRGNSSNGEGQGYGKIFVEDVTETPPVGVQIIGSGR